MRDLVSIIVPVYNVAQYLDRCLDSLVKQTSPNIEIILVNDGSTDDSGAICDLWKERDGRIRVFHKPNGGLSDARNFGLQRASGEYICFIDSDDWIDLRFVEVMLRFLVETGADVVECDYLATSEDAPALAGEQTVLDYSVYQGKECFLRYLTNDFFVSVCNKLYRRSLLKNQPFRLGVYHEDEFWTYRIFGRACKACRLSYTGYYYYQRQGSIVHTTPSQKRLTDAFNAAKERVAFIEQHYPEYASIGYSKMMYTCMCLYNQAGCSDFLQREQFCRELICCYRSIFRKYLKTGQFRGEMWRFCFFSLLPDRYCRLNF